MNEWTLKMRILHMHMFLNKNVQVSKKVIWMYLSLLERPCSSPGRLPSACFPPQGHYLPHQPLRWSAWWLASPCDTQEQPAEGDSGWQSKTKISSPFLFIGLNLSGLSGLLWLSQYLSPDDHRSWYKRCSGVLSDSLGNKKGHKGFQSDAVLTKTI